MQKCGILVLILLFCLPIAASARRDTGPPEWTFDDAADLVDWRDSHDLSPMLSISKVRDSNGVERSILTITSIGDNPFVYPGGSVANWEPFSGYEHRYIYIGARIDKTDTWQVDYKTSRSEEFSDRQSQKFMVNSSQDFQDIKLDMHWDGIISGFRIHFGSGKNKTTELDYVSLRGAVIVTQTPRKLATTWGKVKDLF